MPQESAPTTAIGGFSLLDFLRYAQKAMERALLCSLRIVPIAPDSKDQDTLNALWAAQAFLKTALSMASDSDKNVGAYALIKLAMDGVDHTVHHDELKCGGFGIPWFAAREAALVLKGQESYQQPDEQMPHYTYEVLRIATLGSMLCRIGKRKDMKARVSAFFRGNRDLDYLENWPAFKNPVAARQPWVRKFYKPFALGLNSFRAGLCKPGCMLFDEAVRILLREAG